MGREFLGIKWAYGVSLSRTVGRWVYPTSGRLLRSAGLLFLRPRSSSEGNPLSSNRPQDFGEIWHRAFQGPALQDARVSPLRVFGYAITYQNGRVLVGLDEETYRHLRADFLRLALRRTPHTLARKFWSLPFEPYGPVYRQVLTICKAVNRKRKTGGLPLVPSSTLRRLRRSYRPFDTVALKTVF